MIKISKRSFAISAMLGTLVAPSKHSLSSHRFPRPTTSTPFSVPYEALSAGLILQEARRVAAVGSPSKTLTVSTIPSQRARSGLRERIDQRPY